MPSPSLLRLLLLVTSLALPAAVHSQESICARPGYFACPPSLDGGCCPDGLTCGLTECYLPIQQADSGDRVDCPGNRGYFLCPEFLGDGCCPGGYICNDADDSSCLLTLKLSIITKVYTTTEMSGTVPSTTYLVTTTTVVGDGITVVDRIAPTTRTNTTVTISSSTGSSERGERTGIEGGARTGGSEGGARNETKEDWVPTAGQIAGIVIGIVVLLSLSGTGAYIILRYRKRRAGPGTEGSWIEEKPELGETGKSELDATGSLVSELQSKSDVSELPVAIHPQELCASREFYELESESYSRVETPPYDDSKPQQEGKKEQ